MIKTRWLMMPVLILLVILPRLSIDLYLPSLLNIGKKFHTDSATLQMTLTFFMLGYALSMLIVGPLCDYFGKKPVLLLSLTLYASATILCMVANTFMVLVAARFFQALGGCSGTVIARLFVKDSYSSKDQIKILAQLSAAMAICPLLIPILGGVIQTYSGWRSVFFFLLILALILILVCKKQLHETQRLISKPSIRKLCYDFKKILSNQVFIGYSLAIGLAWSCYFAFTIESPFLLQEKLGYTSFKFSVLYAITILGYLAGTGFTKRYANQIGWDKLIFTGTLCCLAGAVLMTFLNQALDLHWFTLITPMIIILFGVGIIIPGTQAAVIQPFSHNAGTASGLFFFIQMLFGFLCGVILQRVHNGSITPLLTVLLLSSLLLVLSFYFTILRPQTLAQVSVE
ncbi:multidrug effflux MFS transporter [Legionella dresdenensis]|uniref:Bcr/CflA family efflux transporter n=1 Tax=Legionella dresdenensis TaxID=450200 RepID=A0ABV8CF22_9GAMM